MAAMKPKWLKRLEEELHVGPSRTREGWWQAETRDIRCLFFPPLLPLQDVVHCLLEEGKTASEVPTCAVRASANSAGKSLVVMTLEDFLEVYRLYVTARRELRVAEQAAQQSPSGEGEPHDEARRGS